ncbi:hypothetical protein [Derxia lacustris]|uniref:hypothetical protein n=1 Tax=Derxia lacustris TaxID=764842 RepID=UPI000A1778E0|nr:hypothetical protein [Derxia lacustris]
MTGPSASIARRQPEADDASFERLLARGVELAQALSGGVWTDYNAHDPGLTLLEQLCFALTEVIYRNDFPVADHLAASDGRLDADLLALPPPARALPCRATTADDYRRLLLDRIDELDDAMPAQAGSTPGLWTLALRASRVEAASLSGRARAVWLGQRNLGEDLDPAVATVAERDCELVGEIEIGGARDPVEIAADIHASCARYIADRPQRHRHDELIAAGASVEDVFTGPDTPNGVFDTGAALTAKSLYVGDLRQLVADIDGVREVLSLALQPPPDADGQPARPVTGSLPWRDVGWALRLRAPDRPGFPELPRLALLRRGRRVDIDPAAFAARFHDQRTAIFALREAVTGDMADLAELPRGRHRQLDRHRSIALDLPEVYGVGRRGLPHSADAERRAAALQLKAYLALFDQILANGLAHLQQARRLFSTGLDAGIGAGWRLLDDDALPGIDALWRNPPERIERGVYLDSDRWADRKHRALDHLLALHGESLTQNTQRQFLGHLWPAGQEQALLRNKADYLIAILTLGRDRAAGFDYSRPSWGRSDNGCSLARRVGLLLGFEWSGSRPLATEVMHWRAHFARMAPDAAPAGGEGMRLLARLLGGRADLLDDALLGAACHERNFSLRARNDGQTLLLALDEAGTAPRELGRFDSAAEAWRAARALRGLALHLARRAEGLHLVEHLLLRPLGRTDFHRRALGTDDGAAFDAALADFCAARVSLVLPAWGPRCGDPLFRHHLADLVREHAPAHLLVEPVWLDSATLGAFETDYEKWLADRVALAAADPASGPDDDLLRRHDRHAARLARLLRQAGARP